MCDCEDEEINDEFLAEFNFDKIMKLVLEAKKVIKKSNKTYYFTCPNCKKEAYGGKAGNGHLHVKCEYCNIAMCQ